MAKQLTALKDSLPEQYQNAEKSSSGKFVLPEKRISLQPLSGNRLFQILAPSIVLIKTNTGSGSGVAITDQGHILTCEHVVKDGGSIEVFCYSLADNQLIRKGPFVAKLALKDLENDIAVLKMDNFPKTMRGVSFADKNPETGSKVYVIGNPGMGNQVLEQTMTEGIISASSRTLDDKVLLQHSAAVNPGNSGGPLLSPHGVILGLVTQKANMENVGFAIPASTLNEIIKNNIK